MILSLSLSYFLSLVFSVFVLLSQHANHKGDVISCAGGGGRSSCFARALAGHRPRTVSDSTAGRHLSQSF